MNDAMTIKRKMNVIYMTM